MVLYSSLIRGLLTAGHVVQILVDCVVLLAPIFDEVKVGKVEVSELVFLLMDPDHKF